MIEADDALYLSVVAFFAMCAAVLVFSLGRRAPESYGEQLALWFHSLEFALLCGVFAVGHPAARYYGGEGTLVFYGVLAGGLLLLGSSLVYWRSDRVLCCYGFAWLLVSGLYFWRHFPVVE